MSTDAVVSLSVTVDRLETAHVATHQSEGYPLAVWVHFDGFGLWGYQAAAFRRFAASLTQAADMLDADVRGEVQAAGGK